jgi:hypothetical protein
LPVISKPGTYTNGVSGGFLRKALGGLVQGPRGIEPRKGQLGAEGGSIQARRARVAGQRVGEEMHRERRMVLPASALRALVNRDDIIWSIRRTLRMAIGELGWHVVPDLEHIKADLKRWHTIVKLNLDMPGFDIQFQPLSIKAEWFARYTGVLKDVIRGEEETAQQAGQPPYSIALSPRIQGFFENVLAHHEVEAEKHTQFVQQALERPNPSAESSFRVLLDKIVESLTIFDAAAIVKNPTIEGTLGELYDIPGEHVRVYRNRDRSTPQPPEIAYDWKRGDQVIAYYNNVELVYMMVNPQDDGYGKSPLEFLVDQIVGAIYGDAYLIDWFANNNIPPAIFDLGPYCDPEERDAMEEQWDQRVSKGKHRVVFTSGKDGIKGFMPLNVQSNKDAQIIENFKLWANRKCAAYGMSLNDIGFTEDLHRTTADTQARLTQIRGVQSMAKVIEEYINGEIVKGRMWMRDEPMDITSVAGRAVPVFPWNDVRFAFKMIEREQKLEEAQRMIGFLQSGVMNRNEIRKELGLPPITGGNIYTIMGGGVPIKVEDLGKVPAPGAGSTPGTPALEPGKPGGEGLPGAGTQMKQMPSGNLPALEIPGQPRALPAPPGQPPAVAKAVAEVKSLADDLRKMAESTGEKSNG